MAVRTLRTFHDEALRTRCREVAEVNSHIRRLLDDLAQTMYHTPLGAGLAAPQVGVLRRAAVINMGDGLIELINPVIVGTSGHQECIEGCLSFPGCWAKTIRPLSVTVEALNRFGKPFLISGERELAKCLCHEIDHLDGIVMRDRAVEYGRIRKKK